MVNHKLKLFYFNNRGRAEHIRQILKLVGAPFEDVRIDPERWPAFKTNMPFGQVPVLEVDGVKIAQSEAIARFVAEEYGLTAGSNLQKARLDMIASLISEASNSEGIKQWPLVVLGMIQVPDKEAFFREKVRPGIDHYAGIVEKFLVENASNSLLIGDKETWVDVYAAEFFSKFIEIGEKDSLEAFPHVQSLIDRIHNIPVIREHIKQRPKTLF